MFFCSFYYYRIAHSILPPKNYFCTNYSFVLYHTSVWLSLLFLKKVKTNVLRFWNYTKETPAEYCSSAGVVLATIEFLKPTGIPIDGVPLFFARGGVCHELMKLCPNGAIFAHRGWKRNFIFLKCFHALNTFLVQRLDLFFCCHLGSLLSIYWV